MDDRELLELAAKAAGMNKLTEWSDGILDHDSPHYGYPALHEAGPGGACGSWNPLTDDGDALRLAVKLCMNCDFLGAMTGVIFINPSDEDKDGHLQEGPHKGVSDLQSARRAIVRAAAEIGRAM